MKNEPQPRNSQLHARNRYRISRSDCGWALRMRFCGSTANRLTSLTVTSLEEFVDLVNVRGYHDLCNYECSNYNEDWTKIINACK